MRRNVAWSAYLCGSGAVTAICALTGFELVSDRHVVRVSSALGALLGASADGTFLMGGLVLLLAMMPRDGFAQAALVEEERLRADGRPSRRRQTATRPYLTHSAFVALALTGGIIAAALLWWLAIPMLMLAGRWLARTSHPDAQASRADEVMPLHPTTLLATVAAGVSLPFLLHGTVPFLEPASRGPAVNAIYLPAALLLHIGYVVFAAGHPRDPSSGLLPSLHTVGRWCGIAALSWIGLTCSLLGIAHVGGWFTFWMVIVSVPSMYSQLLLAHSPNLMLRRLADSPASSQ